MYIEYVAKFDKKKEEGTFFADDAIVAKLSLSAISNEFIIKQYKKSPDFLQTIEVKKAVE